MNVVNQKDRRGCLSWLASGEIAFSQTSSLQADLIALKFMVFGDLIFLLLRTTVHNSNSLAWSMLCVNTIQVQCSTLRTFCVRKAK